jgi:predicted nucleotidyltransferase
MSIFGYALGDGFGPESDLDVLVEFDKGCTPGFAFVWLQRELTGLMGVQVALRTYHSLSRYFRDEVLAQSQTIYEHVSERV